MFAENIDSLKKYQEELKILSERWNLLTLLGKMSNIDMDMTDTRENFDKLTKKLLNQLEKENVDKVINEITSKAQVSIDIIIRNLFERTADIGFLATDDDIRKFILNYKNHDLENLKLEKEKLKKRFKEYVLKYSVYENIILLDTNGNIICQLKDDNHIQKSKDSIINTALTTNEEYVEEYKKTELTSNKNKDLLYAYKVQESFDNNKNIGVLILVFRFENEMKDIFNKLKSSNDWFELMLLDNEGYVISSSDEYHIPINIKLPIIENDYHLIKFASNEYISTTCNTKGYQGFKGLGWYGHILIPLHKAFNNIEEDINLKLELLEYLLKNSNLFSQELKDIPQQALDIQKKLDKTVWNGNILISKIKENNSFAKTLLNEISLTGIQTKDVFNNSIKDLNKTVINSSLNKAKFQASLAIDIMDRNLYERANDCRWWALTTTFREYLTHTQSIDETKTKIMNNILKYINDLYTVYTLLMIYDKNGKIIAVSQDQYQNLINQNINEEWINQTLSIKSTQDYCVSDFEKSIYYKNEATYIYNAPIFNFNDQTVGGIAIVFDSTPQFKAILEDSLPIKNIQNKENCFGIFINQENFIISSTNENIIKSGEVLDKNYQNILSEILDFSNNQSNHQLSEAKIIQIKDYWYIVGIAKSKGYREYKISDNYHNEVYALMFIKIAENNHNNKELNFLNENLNFNYPKVNIGEETTDISTFQIYKEIFGLESKYIITSLTNQKITSILGSSKNFIGMIDYSNETIPIVSIHNLLKINETSSQENIIIIETNNKEKYGILIDKIIDSPEIPNRVLKNCKDSLNDSTLIKYIVQNEMNNSQTMLSILDVDALYQFLLKN